MVAEREIEVALAAADARRTTVMHITDLDKENSGNNLDEEMNVNLDDAANAMHIDEDHSEGEERAQDPKGKKKAVSKKAPAKVCENCRFLEIDC